MGHACVDNTINRYDIDETVWALSKDGKAIVRTKVEAVFIAITKDDTSVKYRLVTGMHTWGEDVPENRIFPNHQEARVALDGRLKHG